MKQEPKEKRYVGGPGMFDFSQVSIADAGGLAPYAPLVKSKQKALRAASQCQRILDRLRLGRAPHKELQDIASQYNARIFTLRGLGHNIPPPDQDHETGMSWYHLEVTR